MRRKVLSVLSALCMVVVMLLGAGLPVQAADTKAEQTATVTIDGLSIGRYDPYGNGEITTKPLTGYRTIDMYRLIKLNFSEDGNSLTDPTHIWTDEMAAWLKGAGSAKYGKYLEEVKIGDTTYNAVTEDFRKLQSDPENYPNATPDEDGSIIPNSGKEITQFYQDVASAIKGGTLEVSTDNVITTTNTSWDMDLSELSIENVTMGTYIALYSFEQTKQDKYYIDNSIYYPIGINVFPDNETLELQPNFKYTIKHDIVSITKEVNDEGDVYNGQEVTYTLKTTIPYYPGNTDWETIHFVIGDEWDSKIELFGKDSIQILYNSDNSTIEETNYSIDYDAESRKFQITFKPNWLKVNQGQTIKIEYKAKINLVITSPNSTVTGNAYENTATLEYTKNPYVDDSYGTVKDTELLESYTIFIQKMDREKENVYLQGAEFRIRKAGESEWLKFIRQDTEDKGPYSMQSLTYILAADQKDAKATDTIVISDETYTIEQLVIRGLEPGEYEIQETKAPAGYIKPQGSFIIKLLNRDPGQTGMGQGYEVIEKGNYDVEAVSGEVQLVKIYNKSVGSLDLPVTGGMGTLVFTVGGLAVMGGAVLLFIRNKKKTN